MTARAALIEQPYFCAGDCYRTIAATPDMVEMVRYTADDAPYI